MTFGTGGDQGGTPSGGFDFMLGSTRSGGGLDTSIRTDPRIPVTSGQGSGGSDRPRRNRRRSRGIDSGALVRTAVVVVLALAVVGIAGFTAYTLVQNAEAEVRADSAAFCADIGATPGVLSEPGFGWPSDSSAGIGGSLEAMKLYQARWENLATVGPPSIRSDLAAIATAAATITTSVETSNTIDRPANLAAIEKVTSQTALRAWAKKYCD